MATGFVAQARATARTAVGLLMAFATSEYERSVEALPGLEKLLGTMLGKGSIEEFSIALFMWRHYAPGAFCAIRILRSK